MSDKPVRTCPKCKAKKVEKLISQTSFTLKGGGWYSDLYAGPKPGAVAQGGLERRLVLGVGRLQGVGESKDSSSKDSKSTTTKADSGTKSSGDKASKKKEDRRRLSAAHLDERRQGDER